MRDNGGNGRKGYIVAPPKPAQRQWACTKGHCGTYSANETPPQIGFTQDNRPSIHFCLACLRDFLYTADVGRMMITDLEGGPGE